MDHVSTFIDRFKMCQFSYFKNCYVQSPRDSQVNQKIRHALRGVLTNQIATFQSSECKITYTCLGWQKHYRTETTCKQLYLHFYHSQPGQQEIDCRSLLLSPTNIYMFTLWPNAVSARDVKTKAKAIFFLLLIVIVECELEQHCQR